MWYKSLKGPQGVDILKNTETEDFSNNLIDKKYLYDKVSGRTDVNLLGHWDI